MDNLVVNNHDELLERDSLSDESVSNDSLLNDCHTEDNIQESPSNIRRRSYTLETSPEMSTSVRNSNLTQPIYVQTDQHLQFNESQKSSELPSKTKTQKVNMSQSLYERPSSNFSRNNSLSSTKSKIREEKLRLATEEQERKQKQKLAVLTESEKILQNLLQRKQAESLRKINENKRKATERQRIVDDRRERLNKAEEVRRKTLLKKLINHSGKKPSPQSSNNMMTMSCFGGFSRAKTRPGNKEVVQNRFLNTRPVSSTGKIIGFGSSTPRPICETASKPNSDGKKIPEAVMIKCELLSRPIASRMPENMVGSVISPKVPTNASKKPRRQLSLIEYVSSQKMPRSTIMTASVIDDPPKIKPKSCNVNKTLLKSNATIKEETPRSATLTKKSTESKRLVIPENRSSSASSNKTKKGDEDLLTRKVVQSKSGTFPRQTRRTKVDTHIDSDSIEEEVPNLSKPIKSPHTIMTRSSHNSQNVVIKPKVQIIDQSQVSTNQESNSQVEISRAPLSKDISETEYKARLMENRRLVREKREREREEVMRKEREKRHADEIAAREMMELEREKHNYTEETNFTTSNDDAIEVTTEPRELNRDALDNGESQLSEIPEIPVITCIEAPQELTVRDDEKNERKKKLDSIMSRIRKPNDESSSEGGVSPRRAMSPEPAELEQDVNNVAPTQAFRSSLLQSMMSKGRLTKVVNQNKDTKEEVFCEDNAINIPQPIGPVLPSVRESVEDTESITSPSSSVIDNAGIDGTTLQDIKLEFVSEPLREPVRTNENDIRDKENTTINGAIREDCDGKEDSIILDENRDERNCLKIFELQSANKTPAISSSAETEGEEIINTHFDMDSLYDPRNLNPVIQEGYVFQN